MCNYKIYMPGDLSKISCLYFSLEHSVLNEEVECFKWLISYILDITFLPCSLHYNFWSEAVVYHEQWCDLPLFDCIRMCWNVCTQHIHFTVEVMVHWLPSTVISLSPSLSLFGSCGLNYNSISVLLRQNEGSFRYTNYFRLLRCK